MKNTWKWIVTFVLVLALISWCSWNSVNNNQPNTGSGISEDWKEGVMEISGIKFHYPSNWYLRKGYIPSGKSGKGKSEYIQLFSTHDFNAEEKAKGYLCLDFRDYPKTGYHIWNCKNELGIREKKIVMTKSGNIELTYSGANSIANSIVSSCIIKGDREIGITISFNCVQSDDEYLHDRNSNFNNRPEILTMEKILKTIEFIKQ